MNKTINIHLAQINFSLDEKGYFKLKSYLKELDNLFDSTIGKEDIIEDIESRIAELFNQFKKFDDYVISEKEVESVIQTMGSVEDLSDDEILNENPSSKTSRKFFRDPDDYWIGGVAGGISKYYNLSSAWVRIILLILLIFGVPFTILIYVLFWVFTPEAKTTLDKIKMKGESVNINSIKNKIKEGYEEFSSSVEYDENKIINSISVFFKSIIKAFIKIIPFILKAVAYFVGILLFIISLFGIIGLISGFLLTTFFTDIPFSLNILGFGLEGILIFCFCVFTLGIPLLFLFNLSLILISRNPKIMLNTFSTFILLGFWVFSIILIIFMITVGVLNMELMNYNSIFKLIIK